MARRARSIHFVGIGGIGMSGLAEILLRLGHSVSGSDVKDSETVARLRSLGARISVGHARENVDHADVVVYSSAVPSSNPELTTARTRKIPVIPRAEMLAELMRLKDGIAVAGSHGKTTTTSLLGSVLAHSRMNPTIVVGGKLNRWGSTGLLGDSELLVAEADESDGSFLLLRPVVAVVTNIDPEHLDAYGGSLEALDEAFVRFINSVPFHGAAVVCLDDPGVRRILPRIQRPVCTYGTSPQADIQLCAVRFVGPQTEFEVGGLGCFTLNMLGRHNAMNALAVVAVARDLGLSAEQIRRGLSAFEGVDRRFSVRGVVGDIIVVDDYGHHPTEIRATLRGARDAYPNRRIVVGFQPHRFTRTRDLLSQFGACFDEAAFLGIAPIYAAGEEPLLGVDAERLATEVRARGHKDCLSFASVTELENALVERSRAGDLVLLLGAGDIYHSSHTLLRRLGCDVRDRNDVSTATTSEG
ncbi:MAG: UDP-N-acetylmuramate--L-alanine ligase [Myxococcota bacterium]